MPDPNLPNRTFLPHPDAERFDQVVVDTVERWKESELSGDEWRFSYRVSFRRHGTEVAVAGGASVRDALLNAAYLFDRVEAEGPFLGDLSEVCCQPGCPDPWVVLLHPIKRYSRTGEELTRSYDERDVRGFCARHEHRGDCALDDADPNYRKVADRR